MKKGQGMFEYILLLAGILLIVVLAIVVLRGGLFGGAEQDIKMQNCQAALSRASGCYYTNGSGWNPYGYVTQPSACVTVTGYTDGSTTIGSCTDTASDSKICCKLEPGS